MRVDEIDARTAPDETLAYFADVEHACAPELAPGEPLRTTDEVVAHLRHQPTTHTSCHWVADGGVASLYVHGPTAAFADVRVLPGRRREGTGGALLEQVVARCRALAARSVYASHATAAGAAFAARFGFVDDQRIVHSLLDLRAKLPEPRPPAGWRVVTWLRRIPDEHLDAFVRARGAIDDAPAPDGMELPPITAEWVRTSEESLARRKREMRVTVAIRDDGEIGAFTELRVSQGSTLGFTDDTATVEAHRRRGLGRAVKLESLRRLRADHPEIDVVSTSNAEENTAMLGLNVAIGFRPKLVWTTASLTL